jgi:hypothetical protein
VADTFNGQKVLWAPQGAQGLFLHCTFFEALFEGNRGGGKTDTLIMDFAKDVGKGHKSDWRGILFRQTYPQLQDVIAKTKKWYPQMFGSRCKYNEALHQWAWESGEMLMLRQFKRDDDYWNYHGHEYPWQGWEELCNWATPSGFKRMQSTARSSNPRVAKIARVRATTNPYGPGHNWVKHRYRLPGGRFVPILDSKDDDGRLEPARIAIHGSLWDNKILLASDPNYVDRIRASARNQAELKAWLEGSWDIVAGGMFDDVWDPRHNIVKPFPVPPSWRLDRAFDWGSSKPFSVGWWAESDGTDLILPGGLVRSTVRGDLYRIHEWYGWNGKPNEGLRMLATDVAAGVVEREVRWNIHDRVKAGPADSSIFDVENGVSIAEDMKRRVRFDDGRSFKGVYWTPADKRSGSRKSGWEMMRKMLKAAHPPEAGGPREHPGLFTTSGCMKFIDLIPVLPRDEKDPDDLDTDAEDHIADEARYRVRASGQQVRSGRTVGMY